MLARSFVACFLFYVYVFVSFGRLVVQFIQVLPPPVVVYWQTWGKCDHRENVFGDHFETEGSEGLEVGALILLWHVGGTES